jgi:hypothetical protein
MTMACDKDAGRPSLWSSARRHREDPLCASLSQTGEGVQLSLFGAPQETIPEAPQVRIPSGSNPMVRLWAQTKQQYPGVLLLWKVVDFYEAFGEDAEELARVLNLTLTSRPNGDDRIAMAGFPVHTLDRYLRELVAAGVLAAVCEQTG